MKKIIGWFLLAIFILPLGTCVGHRVLTKAIFKEWCENNTGLFVYERVGLGQEYFYPSSENKDSEYSYILGDVVLNKNIFEEAFVYAFSKKTKVSNIGPIFSVETTVLRKHDSKLLAKAVSGEAYVSLVKDLGSNMPEKEFCPNKSNSYVKKAFYQDHIDILKHTFSVSNARRKS